ncbi:MAG: RNA polymerase sigma factor [Armatimonadetes bacterium]|nr:RNA polymerase sigma factor [Armatimonadota bacterium]
MQDSDEDIVGRVQRGNRELFHVLFERHHDRIAAYVRRSLGDVEEARDAVAEVFVRAYQGVDTFDLSAGTRYLTYLYTIAHNLLTDRWRRQGDTGDAEDSGQTEEIADGARLPLEQMLRREMIERVRQSIAKLPPDHQQIIHLAFDRDLSSADIMQIMNKSSITAVTSHLHRAMKRLKIVLERDGYFLDSASKGGDSAWQTRTQNASGNS